MDKHNRRDYPGARENTYLGSYSGPPSTIECSSQPSRFSTCDEGSKKKKSGDIFFSYTVWIPDPPKILTVGEIFEHELRDTRRSAGSRGKATVTSWHGYAKQSLSDEFMRDIISRIAKFPPPKETVARGKIQMTSRISRIVDFFPTNVRTVLCKAKYRLHLK